MQTVHQQLLYNVSPGSDGEFVLLGEITGGIVPERMAAFDGSRR